MFTSTASVDIAVPLLEATFVVCPVCAECLVYGESIRFQLCPSVWHTKTPSVPTSQRTFIECCVPVLFSTAQMLWELAGTSTLSLALQTRHYLRCSARLFTICAELAEKEKKHPDTPSPPPSSLSLSLSGFLFDWRATAVQGHNKPKKTGHSRNAKYIPYNFKGARYSSQSWPIARIQTTLMTGTRMN